MKTKMSSSKTHASLLSVALAAAVLTLNAHATSLESLATVPEAQDSVAAQLSQAAELAAHQNLPITYLESTQAKALLGDKASPWVQEKGATRKIIVVESGNHNKDLMTQLLAQGNFVVSIGNAEIDATQSGFDMLMDIADAGTLKKSREAYDLNQSRLHAVDADGRVSVASLTAYYYSPKGSHTFYSTTENTSDALSEAILWAGDLVMTEGSTQAKVGGWEAKLTRDYTQRCDAGRNNIRYGQTTVKSVYSKLGSDGDPSWDHWNVRLTTQLVPGAQLQSGSTWKNTASWIKFDADDTWDNWELDQYEPTTSPGTSTVGVELSLGGPSVNWSYSVSDIQIEDEGMLADELAGWHHNINENKSVGSNSVKLEPGVSFRSGNLAPSVWNSVYESYKSEFENTAFLLHDNKSCAFYWE